MKKMCIALLGLAGFMAAPASADLIYESATMGAPGQTGGYSLMSSQFLGSRFTIEETTQVTAIGGHLYASSGTLFGAILSMEGMTPLGLPFDTEEVMASTVFNPGYPSSEFVTALSVTLAPGDYALIFGSGYFGASGSGAMPYADQTDTAEGVGSYFFWNGSSWSDGGFDRCRFLVFPAPGALSLLGLGVLCGLRRRR